MGVPSDGGIGSESRKSKESCAYFVRGRLCKTGVAAEGAEVNGVL